MASRWCEISPNIRDGARTSQALRCHRENPAIALVEAIEKKYVDDHTSFPQRKPFIAND
jgi:hypothetical protein